MQATTHFMLLAAIFAAPHMDKRLAITLAAVSLGVSILCRLYNVA